MGEGRRLLGYRIRMIASVQTKGIKFMQTDNLMF